VTTETVKQQHVTESIPFIASKAQDACANNTRGYFTLKHTAPPGFLLITDVSAVFQILNLYATHHPHILGYIHGD
jgi:hypothetical protein